MESPDPLIPAPPPVAARASLCPLQWQESARWPQKIFVESQSGRKIHTYPAAGNTRLGAEGLVPEKKVPYNTLERCKKDRPVHPVFTGSLGGIERVAWHTNCMVYPLPVST